MSKNPTHELLIRLYIPLYYNIHCNYKPHGNYNATKPPNDDDENEAEDDDEDDDNDHDYDGNGEDGEWRR